MLDNRKYKLILGFLLLPFLFILSTDRVNAEYSSITLSPASGSISTTGTAINVVANTGSETFIGIAVALEYTGPITYVRASSTTGIACDNMDVHETTNSTNGNPMVVISCVNMSGSKYNGPVLTLLFKAKESTGMATLNFVKGFPSTNTATTMTGGTYNLVLGVEGRGGGDLPQSGIFDNVSQKVLIGSSLVMASVLLAISPIFLPKLSLLAKNTHNLVSNTIIAVLTKQKENSEKRRRGKLERKF